MLNTSNQKTWLVLEPSKTGGWLFLAVGEATFVTTRAAFVGEEVATDWPWKLLLVEAIWIWSVFISKKDGLSPKKDGT